MPPVATVRRREQGGGHRPSARAVRAVVAGLVALLLLTGTGAARAGWFDEVSTGEGARLASGQVQLTQTTTVIDLLSRQPAGSRTYTSSRGCTVPSGWVECRVITDSVTSERLVVGDRLRMRQDFTFGASGTNLTGTLTFDTSRIPADPPAGPQSGITVTSSVRGPVACSGTETVLTCPVDLARDQGPGTYQVFVDVVTPPTDGQARWDTRVLDQRISLGAVRATFEQGAR